VTARHGSQPAQRLRVDPVACDGIGICAHLAAGLIAVDSWGFPIVPAGALDGRQRRAAEKVVAACPRRALFLEAVPLRPAGRGQPQLTG
jgi:ferredoxin